MRTLPFIAIVCACQVKPLVVRSHPRVGEIVIDGDGADWSEVALEKMPDIDASFSVQHDGAQLYVLVMTSDPQLGALMRRDLQIIIGGAQVPAISRFADDKRGISAIELRIPFVAADTKMIPIDFLMQRAKKDDDEQSGSGVRFSGGGMGGGGSAAGGRRSGPGGGRSPLAARPQEDRGPPEISLHVNVEIHPK